MYHKLQTLNTRSFLGMTLQDQGKGLASLHIEYTTVRSIDAGAH